MSNAFTMPQVKSRKQHEGERASIILDAIVDCHEQGVSAKAEWLKELTDFNKNLPKHKV